MTFSRRRFGLLVTAPAIAAAVGSPAVAAPARTDVVGALRRAATFLDERLSYRGGYGTTSTTSRARRRWYATTGAKNALW